MTQGPEQVAEAMQQYETIDPSKIINEKDEVLNILQEYKKGGLTCSIKNDFFEFTKTDQNGQLETRYIRKKRLDELIRTDNAINDAGKDIEFLKNDVSTKKDLDKILDNGGQNNEQIGDKEKLLIDLDNLEEKYKGLKKNLSGGEGNGECRRDFIKEIDNNLKIIRKAKRDLNRHSGYSNLLFYQKRVGELSYLLPTYERARQIISVGGRTSDIPSIVDSKSDAKRATKRLEKESKHQEDMNELLKNAAILALKNDDNEGFEEYLSLVQEGIVEPSSTPFYTKHKKSFLLIQQQNPDLYSRFCPTGPSKIPYETYCQTMGTISGQTIRMQNGTVCHPCETGPRRFGRQITTMLESRGMNKDKDPRKEEAWTKIGGLAAIVGGIFMGIEAIKSLKKDKDGNRNRGGAIGRGIGTLAAFNADKVLGLIQDATGRHPEEKLRASQAAFEKFGFDDENARAIAESYYGAPHTILSTMAFIPVQDLKNRNILEQGQAGVKFNYDNYVRYINSQNWTTSQVSALTSEARNIQNSGFTVLGINNLNDLGNGNTKFGESPTVQQKWNEINETLSSPIHAELFKQGFKAKNDKIEDIQREYNEKGKINNETILERIKKGYIEFADGDKTYSVESILQNPDEYDIDLEKMTLKGFNNGSNEIKFDNYGNLFYAANLTKWIKENFRGRDAKSDKPFHISPLGRIEFDDTNWYEIWKNETDVLKKRTLKKDSSLLNGNKEAYVNYLNERWKQDQESIMESQKIDLSSYPIVSNLGIDFFGENGKQEAHSLEIWMNEIKEGKKFSVPVENGQPFTVKWRFLNLGNDLVFTAINGNKEVFNKNISKEFPTIVKDEINRKKFENYLNDPQNQMWGSAIN